MRVILTDDVVGLGDIGETVKVRAGYARNFLVPRGFAVEIEAISANVIKHRMTQIESKKKKLRAAAEEFASVLRNVVVPLTLKVATSGTVFGSIHSKDIASKLKELGHEIDRRRVLLEEPIKKLGTHFVGVRLHAEVTVQLKVEVSQEAASAEEEEREAKKLKEELERKSVKKQEQLSQTEEISQ